LTNVFYTLYKVIHNRLLRLTLILIASIFSTTYCIPAYAANPPLISEVELNPAGSDIGREKVELYNPSNNAIDVSGWTITSTGGAPAAVVINQGTIISPKNYLVIGRDSQQWLDNNDEVIELRNASGMLIDSAGPFSDGSNDDETWQRSSNGRLNWVFSINTLGGSNNITDALVSDTGSSSLLLPQHPELPTTPLAKNSTFSNMYYNPSSHNLTMTFIDVGQGDSILVTLPNTKTLLIDGGEQGSFDKILSTLQEHGLSHIDVVVATHPHADHIGGLIDIINSVDVGQVLDSGQIHTTQTFEDFLVAIDNKHISLKSIRESDSINLDPAVKIDVLNPPASLVVGASDESQFNDNSVVLKLKYGNFSALLTGDMQQTNEQRLVSENASALDIDVLKAGHHGSSTSSSSAFLSAVTPEVVIISVGAGNTYGHPHQEAMDRILAAGTKYVFMTDIDGTITLTTNGSSEYSIVTENTGKIVNVHKQDEHVVCCSIR
jgi:beta-lactamase superfamily II metal-dependent hydrolase